MNDDSKGTSALFSPDHLSDEEGEEEYYDEEDDAQEEEKNSDKN